MQMLTFFNCSKTKEASVKLKHIPYPSISVCKIAIAMYSFHAVLILYYIF